jgi:hypothetical protein
MMNYGYNYGFNPMMTAQQRVSYMEQPQGLTTLPVTSIDEANAYRVDINGTPTFFYNQGKGEVYLKRTNTQTGMADFIVFKKEEVMAQPDNFKVINDKLDVLLSNFMPTVEEDVKGGKK